MRHFRAKRVNFTHATPGKMPIQSGFSGSSERGISDALVLIIIIRRTFGCGSRFSGFAPIGEWGMCGETHTGQLGGRAAS
jgi:hypothetical protein